MKHYTIDEIDRYVHGNMSTLAKIRCAIHLKSCNECNNLVLQLEKDESFIQKLKTALSLNEVQEETYAKDSYQKIEAELKGK